MIHGSRCFSVLYRSADVKIFSLPGVFSHGRLDRGTSIFLEVLEDIPSGKILDFGCGTGVISACISSLKGKHDFTLVDSDALALACSEKTMEATENKSFTVLASDVFSEVKEKFDLIVSNPPFHQGVKTNYAATEQFLVMSKSMLHSGGELRIVANSFLHYLPIIKKTFGNGEVLLVKDGFSVYRAVNLH